MPDKNLAPLFEPESVAVIGASGKPGKVGHSVVSNLIEAGYQGKIFPVNPKGGEILGREVVTQISGLPSPLDMAVICIPPGHVMDAMRELAKVGTRSVVVITAGFKEIGREGYYLEQELAGFAEENGMALLGPNCLGLMNPKVGLNASFAAGQANAGNIAFFSQSGALTVAILDWAQGKKIGFSKFVSLGNKAVLDESDMLDYLAEDDDTNVILGYIEGVEDGRRFMRVARNVTKKKPVVLIKSGTTAAGAKAASSHTGAMAGSEQAYKAAFKQAGIIRVEDVSSLFNLAGAFSNQPLPKGPNLAIITNSGGPGIMAADACERSRMEMARLQPSTIDALGKFLPAYASLYNPIDIIGDANAERYKRTLEAVVPDERVHAILVLLTPTASAEIEATAQAIIDASESADKPVFACFMGERRVGPGKEMLINAGVPSYDFPEQAISSLEAMYNYHAWRENPPEVELCHLRDKDKARQVIEKAKSRGCVDVVEFQAQELLKAYNLPVPGTRLARTSDEAAEAAAELGLPVVLKIASPQISHKSDVGGVVAGIETEDEVRRAFIDITSRASRLRQDAVITGCLVQQMAPKGSKEIIIGFSRDSQFGPLIMFGLGGIYVEVLKDISFRLGPLTMDAARDMIRDIKSFPLLRGVRGEPPVNFKAIEEILMIMSQMAQDFPEIQEADFNPVLVNQDKAFVADVRLTLCSEDEAK